MVAVKLKAHVARKIRQPEYARLHAHRHALRERFVERAHATCGVTITRLLNAHAQAARGARHDGVGRIAIGRQRRAVNFDPRKIQIKQPAADAKHHGLAQAQAMMA